VVDARLWIECGAERAEFGSKEAGHGAHHPPGPKEMTQEPCGVFTQAPDQPARPLLAYPPDSASKPINGSDNIQGQAQWLKGPCFPCSDAIDGFA